MYIICVPFYCLHYSSTRLNFFNTACNGDEQCSNKITGLDENKPYAILIVAANSATDDPECITNITILDCRYLVLVVGTEDAKSECLCNNYMYVPLMCNAGEGTSKEHAYM